MTKKFLKGYAMLIAKDMKLENSYSDEWFFIYYQGKLHISNAFEIDKDLKQEFIDSGEDDFDEIYLQLDNGNWHIPDHFFEVPEKYLPLIKFNLNE